MKTPTGGATSSSSDDWHKRGGDQYSYFALLMEEPVLEDVFLYSIFRARKAKLQRLQRQYQLGDSRDFGPTADGLLRSKDIRLAEADRSRLKSTRSGRH
jgi:hypothetical protein